MAFSERILGWAGDEGYVASRPSDDGYVVSRPIGGLRRALRASNSARPKLEAFQILLMLHAVFEVGLWAHQSKDLGIGLSALGLVIAFAIRLLPATSRLGTTSAALIMLCVHLQLFPAASNHLMLVLIGLLILAFFDIAKDDEAQTALATLRWTVAIVFFWTGLQKVFYGSYFQGEFIVWAIAHDGRFAELFQHALSAEEVDRLRRLAAGASEAGVYRTRELLLLIASNGTYLMELLLPCLLLVRRTRTAAWIVAICFLLLIEAGAREIFFGVLFVNFVLLFASQNWVGRLLPISVSLYAVSVASQIGILPNWGLN